MSALRITHINTHVSAGGAAKVAWRLAEAQRAAGHNAHILAGHALAGYPHGSAFDPRPDPLLERLCRQTGQLYHHFQGSHALLEHPLVAGADVLHLHNLHGDYFNPFSLVPLALARPVLWTLHDMQALTGRCAHSFDCEGWAGDCGGCPRPETYPATISTTSVDSAALLLRHKAHLAAVSPVFLAVPSRWLQRKVERSILAALPCRLIPNFCDTGVFAPSHKRRARQRFGLPEDAVLVGASAHGGPLGNQWKGGDASRQAILALLERNPAIRFVNIGAQGPSTQPWLINVPHQESEADLAEALSALDLFLYTPVADNCPLVVLEALSCGLPIATFGVGGIPELVRHGEDGWVAPPDDVADLVRGAWTLLTDHERRAACSRASRSGAVERFDTGKALGAYMAFAAEAQEAHRRASSRPVPLALEALPPVVRSRAFMEAVAGLERRGLVRNTGPWPREFPEPTQLDLESLCAHAEACLKAGQPARAWPLFAAALRKDPGEARARAGFLAAAQALGVELPPGLAELGPGIAELAPDGQGGEAPPRLNAWIAQWLGAS